MGCIKMKQKKVFLVAGPPGCGKSTWIRSQLTRGCEWISRDNVRFAFLSDEDDYFAHEEDVFDTFINYINQTLERDDVHAVYIDATHLNKRSRAKVLRKVRKDNIEELNCVCFNVPLAVCLSRNNLRDSLIDSPTRQTKILTISSLSMKMVALRRCEYGKDFSDIGYPFWS